jgi:hypothetical protein
MLLNLIRYGVVGLGVAIALGISIGSVHSEIEITGVRGAAPTGAAITAGASALSPLLRVQCWQNGIKIINEDNLRGIRLRNLIERDSVGFKGQDGSNGEVYIIPVNDDSTCLIKSMR